MSGKGHERQSTRPTAERLLSAQKGDSLPEWTARADAPYFYRLIGAAGGLSGRRRADRCGCHRLHPRIAASRSVRGGHRFQFQYLHTAMSGGSPGGGASDLDTATTSGAALRLELRNGGS